MANEFARNISDANFSTTFALPGAASTSTNQATGFDLDADTVKNEHVEMEVSIPALSTTIAPDTKTATVIIETSTTSNFAAIVTSFSKVLTAAGGVGIGASKLRYRPASDSPRYIRAKVTFGALMTDASALSATVKLLF